MRRDLVFDAMTKPEHGRHWWGQLGEGYSVRACEIDLCVGGKWMFVNRHPNGEINYDRLEDLLATLQQS